MVTSFLLPLKDPTWNCPLCIVSMCSNARFLFSQVSLTKFALHPPLYTYTQAEFLLRHIVLSLCVFYPLKIPKRKIKFNHDWTKEFRLISRSRKAIFMFSVLSALVEIGIKGKSAVYQHPTTDKIISPPFPAQVLLFGLQCPPLKKWWLCLQWYLLSTPLMWE